MDGQHIIGNISVKWNASHTFVQRERKDAAFSEMYKPLRDDSLLYFLHNNPQLRDVYPASSGQYGNLERSFRMGASGSFTFRNENSTTIFTAGYNGSYKCVKYRYRELILQYKNTSVPKIYQTFEKDNFENNDGHLPFRCGYLSKTRLVWGTITKTRRKWSYAVDNPTFAPART